MYSTEMCHNWERGTDPIEEKKKNTTNYPGITVQFSRIVKKKKKEKEKKKE